MQIFSKELLMAAGDLHGMYEWTTPGTYSFTLERQTKAMIYIVGGGGPRYYLSGLGWGAGGSGAAFVGGAILQAGVYSVVVGEAYLTNNSFVYTNSALSHATIGNLIIAGSAGSKTTYAQGSPWDPGLLTKSSNLDIVAGSVVVESDGNVGTSTTGGASLFNGWGKGADPNADNQTNGYFKIEW